MPWSASLATPKDRVRLALGDIGPVEVLPDSAYVAVITSAASEAAAARQIAASMASVLALQPVKRTTQGETVDYSERIAHLRRIASGEEPVGLDEAGAAGITAGRISLGFQEEYPDGA